MGTSHENVACKSSKTWMVTKSLLKSERVQQWSAVFNTAETAEVDKGPTEAVRWNTPSNSISLVIGEEATANCDDDSLKVKPLPNVDPYIAGTHQYPNFHTTLTTAPWTSGRLFKSVHVLLLYCKIRDGIYSAEWRTEMSYWHSWSICRQ
jgi:hypothetical protein